MPTSNTIIEQYQDRITGLESQLRQIKRKAFSYSMVRFSLFAGLICSLYFYFRQDYPVVLLLVSVAAVALFLYFVKLHSNIKYRQSIIENLIKINHNELAILRQEPSFLPDGTSYHEDQSYSADLDIFGPRSLYHMIQRCFSEPGRKKLAEWFIHSEFDRATIEHRQAAIATIKDEVNLRQDLLAHGLAQFTEKDLNFFPDQPLIPPSTFRKIKIVRWIPPVITLLSIVGAMVMSNTNMILYGFLLNIILTGLFLKSTMQVMQRADHTLKNLKNYNDPLRVLIKPNYQNELLQKRKDHLIEIQQNLSVLQQRYNLLENRNNLLMGLLLNGFFGYDFIALSLLKNWYDAHASKITGWLDEIAWFEALFSLGTFAYNNPSYTFPTLNQSMGMDGENIRHPFIPDEENVGNALDYTPPLKVILLTGSNMSGKSTFLRSLGVNQVLALTGSVVAADRFQTGLYDIQTSFRKADSIQEHTSLFYAELKKLRHIITSLENSERPALILLDEILRGTNSDDKYYGSKQVLLRLKEQSAMTMLATHDIALAKLEDDHSPIIQNYSFESQIRDGELHFDYKLHHGVAVNKNATFLMEKMGIIN